MTIYWDDDERNTKVFLKQDKYYKDYNEYVSISKIITQYLIEEKEKMYYKKYKNESKFVEYNYDYNIEYISPVNELQDELQEEEKIQEEPKQEELTLFDDNMMYKNIFYV
jgi:hypothetical protein